MAKRKGQLRKGCRYVRGGRKICKTPKHSRRRRRR